MKPKLIDSKKIYNIIKINKNYNNLILNKKKIIYINIFIFSFIFFIFFIFFIKIKSYLKKKNNKL